MLRYMLTVDSLNYFYNSRIVGVVVHNPHDSVSVKLWLDAQEEPHPSQDLERWRWQFGWHSPQSAHGVGQLDGAVDKTNRFLGNDLSF